MKKALMIGIKYPNQVPSEQVISSYNNIDTVRDKLVTLKGFDHKNITILKDDGETDPPTQKNIEMYVDSAVTAAMSTGDKLLIYFSAHGRHDKEGELGILASDLQVVPGRFFRNLLNPAREKTRVTMICEVCESSAFFPKDYFGSRPFGTMVDSAKESLQLFIGTKPIAKGLVFFSASRELSGVERSLPKEEREKLLAVQKCASKGVEVTCPLGVFTAELVNCLVEADKEGRRITNRELINSIQCQIELNKGVNSSKQIAGMEGDDCLEDFYFSD
ncbi:metacaspase-7-like [Lotus japonicus]|uniref:Peptidase C14 caspase domain-containing protein n=1 Tax=Lotus japonicus TaxID=34305 RepID=I3T5T7_LOTJA|nr:metacaspase-7-like [Lotus japonicus]AFK47879.1 unknown [Lotus japonicus]